MPRAIYFDAVGTLIHPQPGAAEVYYAVGQRHGSGLGRDDIARRFRTAFHQQESMDSLAGWRTSEERERRRWQDIVALVLDDVRDPRACFEQLYEHFARPHAWTCEPGAGELLAELQRRGFTLGLASNYDQRLHTVVAGLPELRPIKNHIISSEVGWRKPAPEFFEALVRQAGVPAAEILYIGDDRTNDYEGARTAGMQAVLVDERNTLAETVRRFQIRTGI